MPVTLEQLGREGGVLWSDKTTPCVAKKGGDGAATLAVRLLSRMDSNDTNQCVVRVLGIELTTSSFALYTFSVSVFIQALVFVSFSSIADHGKFLTLLHTKRRLISISKLSKEAAHGIWLYGSHLLHVLDLHRPTDIRPGISPRSHWGDLSWLLFCYP